jgi:hypothetical protein
MCHALKDHLTYWTGLLEAIARWLVTAALNLRRQFGIAWWEQLGIPQVIEGGAA